MNMTVVETPYGPISKQGPWYICPYCDAGVYETLGHMIRHLQKRHPDKKEQQPEKQPLATTQDPLRQKLSQPHPAQT